MSALELVQRITRFRPELDVYILIAQEKEDDVVDALFAEAVDGYFYREERDYRGIYRILNAQIQEKARTPFYDALKSYVWMAKDAVAHARAFLGRVSLRDSPWVNDFYEFMGEHVFDADLSVSVPMLDSLMEPTGVIAEAQEMAAKAFGARRTFFATNGTSTAQQGDLPDAASRPARSCCSTATATSSVHHGVVLSGAHPVYLDSSLNRKYGIYGPDPEEDPPARDRRAPGRAGAGPHLLHLRRPALRPRADHRGGARARASRSSSTRPGTASRASIPAFRPTALEAGADYATQSHAQGAVGLLAGQR